MTERRTMRVRAEAYLSETEFVKFAEKAAERYPADERGMLFLNECLIIGLVERGVVTLELVPVVEHRNES